MLLAVVSIVLLAVPSPASAATVTGTITDNATGQPISGAEVTADINGEPVTRVLTDSSGNYDLQLNPATYSILIFADGYYIQEIGAPPGTTQGVGLEISSLGRSGLDSALVSEATPYVSLFPPTMRWSHEPHADFRSMVLEMSYGGNADVPKSWNDDTLIYKLVNAAGQSVWEVEKASISGSGGGGSGETSPLGSAEGCSFFNGVKKYAKRVHDLDQLRVVAYLQSNPAFSAEAPVVPDMTGCNLSLLELDTPSQIAAHKVLVNARLVDRLPGETKVPGIVTLTINHKKPIRRHTADLAEEGFGEYIRSPALHYGKNTLRISFQPKIASVKAPAAKTIRFKLFPPPRRYRHR